MNEADLRTFVTGLRKRPPAQVMTTLSPASARPELPV